MTLPTFTDPLDQFDHEPEPEILDAWLPQDVIDAIRGHDRVAIIADDYADQVTTVAEAMSPLRF